MGEHKCKLEDAFQIADFFLRLAWVKRKIHTYIKGKHPGGRKRWVGKTSASFLKVKTR